MALHIISPGFLTTVQDHGRSGFARIGIQVSGACDKYALRVANLLAGNYESPEWSAALEFTLTGGTIEFTSPEIIALTGADMQAELNGSRVPGYTSIPVQAGDCLELGTAVDGLRTYLAVLGGIDVPVVMGSRSTNLSCRLGGYLGRALEAGDWLSTKAPARTVKRFQKRIRRAGDIMSIGEKESWLRLPSNPYRIMGNQRCALLRVVPGPQEDAFTESGMITFERSFYRLSADCSRMANKLEGPAIEMVNGADIISDGIVEGAIQVSANGMPIVMLADHQTTGGYAKIGTVISVDVPAMAQLRPGDDVAFKFITPETAGAVLRKEHRKLQLLRQYLETGEKQEWR